MNLLNPLTRSISEHSGSTDRVRELVGMAASQRSPVWLYAHPCMTDLAMGVASLCSSPNHQAVSEESGNRRREYERQRSSNKQGRPVEFRQTIKWENFNDGWPNLFIEDVKEMAGRDVIFIASFHSPEVVFEQLSIIYNIPRYLARSFTLILPYFPTGTMERVDTEGQIATAKTLATLLSGTPLTARGPSQIVVFDIHALQERFYFQDSIIPRLESGIPLLQRELNALPKDEKIAIAFPDDGAYKRFHAMFIDRPTIVCYKIRDGNKRIVKVKDGDPTGCHVVIVDDLVQTGGTLIECAKALIAGGATLVSAYVTHAVFPKDSWKKFVESEVKFKNFWVTDSLPHAREIAQHPPFKLLSLCDIIADVLLGYDLVQ